MGKSIWSSIASCRLSPRGDPDRDRLEDLDHLGDPDLNQLEDQDPDQLEDQDQDPPEDQDQDPLEGPDLDPLVDPSHQDAQSPHGFRDRNQAKGQSRAKALNQARGRNQAWDQRPRLERPALKKFKRFSDKIVN